MRNSVIIATSILLFCGDLFAYQVPNPLLNVKVIPLVSVNASGLFTYQYSISNHKDNNGSIFSVDIFLGQDAELDSSLPTADLKNCAAFFKRNSENILKTKTVTAVGSSAPQGGPVDMVRWRVFLKRLMVGEQETKTPRLVLAPRSQVFHFHHMVSLQFEIFC